MSDSFTSRRFLKKYSLHLLKSGVSVIKTTPFESQEYEIAYDHLETKKTIETKVGFGMITLFLFLVVMGFLYLVNDQDDFSKFFFLLSFVILLIAIITKLRVITIKSYEGQNIELYFTNRNRQEVVAFAEAIINSTNAYLLNKFSKIDKDLPIDNQLANLDFLRTKELITDEIFEQLKDQLLGRENKKSIGYR